MRGSAITPSSASDAATENHRGEMCGVFFKTARFELFDGGHFWLSTTPEKPGSREWGAISPHMVTWVKLGFGRGEKSVDSIRAESGGARDSADR